MQFVQSPTTELSDVMAEEGACPICGFERLQTDQDNCPQCDADLTCFKVLDSIPEELVEPVSEHQSSIVAIRRVPSIAALERESSPESSVTETVLAAPTENIASVPKTPSSSQESIQSIPKTSSGLNKKFRPYRNHVAAMLTFAVILIAIVAVFQLYHLRHLESALQEQKTDLKRSLALVSTELAQLNRQKNAADGSTHLSKKASPLTISGSETSDLVHDTQKSRNKKLTTAEISDDKAKPVSLPGSSERMKSSSKSDPEPNTPLESGHTAAILSDSALEDQAELKMEKALSEHDFQNHLIKAGDTLKSISETYYGLTKYYPVVIMLNPGMPIDLQEGNGRLKILKDRRKATELYLMKTYKIGNRLYFSHTITKGDTLKAIALKFYRSKKMIKSILDLNPDSQFRPGEQIRIRLE